MPRGRPCPVGAVRRLIGAFALKPEGVIEEPFVWNTLDSLLSDDESRQPEPLAALVIHRCVFESSDTDACLGFGVCLRPDNDEPLLSGSGDVSKECAEKILETWGDLLSKW